MIRAMLWRGWVKKRCLAIALFVPLTLNSCANSSKEEDKSLLFFQISQLDKEKFSEPTLAFVVTDSTGRKTGERSGSGPGFTEIPEANYGFSANNPEEDDASASPPTVYFNCSPAKKGIYTVEAYFVDASTYSFSISTEDKDGNDMSPEPPYFDRYIPANKTLRFELKYDPKPKASRTTFKWLSE